MEIAAVLTVLKSGLVLITLKSAGSVLECGYIYPKSHCLSTFHGFWNFPSTVVQNLLCLHLAKRKLVTQLFLGIFEY